MKKKNKTVWKQNPAQDKKNIVITPTKNKLEKVKEQALNAILMLINNYDTSSDVSKCVSLYFTELSEYCNDIRKDSEKNEEWEKVLKWSEKVKNLPHDFEHTKFGEYACERGFGFEVEDDGGMIWASSLDRENHLFINKEKFEKVYKTHIKCIDFIKSNLKLYKEDQKGNLMKVDISKVK